MRKLLLVLPALFLVSCAPGVDRRAYLATLVGQPEAEIVRQLGVPTRTFESGGRRFLAYVEQRGATAISGGPFLFGGYGYGSGYGSGFGPGFGPRFGYGYGGAFPTYVTERTCETTFEVAGDRVVSWALRGNSCG